MNLRKLAAILVASTIVVGPALYSQGVQHLQITGTEEALEILPWWTDFTTVQTLSIPSLQVDELVLTIVSSSPGGIIMPVGDLLVFKGFGTGLVYDQEGEHIGDITFYYVGQSLQPLPVFDYIGESKIVGTFFAGPLEGLVINEKTKMEGTVEFTFPSGIPIPTYPYYSAEITGFLTVPEFVDFQALKDSVKPE